MWGRIDNGTVAEITEIDPTGRFHPSLEWIRFDGRTNVQPGWLWDGEMLSPPPQEAASQRRASTVNWLDATADRIRASDRSVGQYLDAEYQLVAQALAEYRNDPGAEVPEAIKSHANAEGLTVEDAAQQIAEAAGKVEDRLLEVRRIRLAGKAAVRDAADDADILGVARPFIEQLEALIT